MRPIGEGGRESGAERVSFVPSCERGKAKKVGYDKTYPGGDKVLRLRRYGIEEGRKGTVPTEPVADSEQRRASLSKVSRSVGTAVRSRLFFFFFSSPGTKTRVWRSAGKGTRARFTGMSAWAP
jgi:hypothetical protein